jgi:hypothetical protein
LACLAVAYLAVAYPEAYLAVASSVPAGTVVEAYLVAGTFQESGVLPELEVRQPEEHCMLVVALPELEARQPEGHCMLVAVLPELEARQPEGHSGLALEVQLKVVGAYFVPAMELEVRVHFELAIPD